MLYVMVVQTQEKDVNVLLDIGRKGVILAWQYML